MCKLCAPSDYFCRANLRCIDTPTFQPGERGQSGTGHGRASWLPYRGEDQEDPGGEQRYSTHLTLLTPTVAWCSSVRGVCQVRSVWWRDHLHRGVQDTLPGTGWVFQHEDGGHRSSSLIDFNPNIKEILTPNYHFNYLEIKHHRI